MEIQRRTGHRRLACTTGIGVGSVGGLIAHCLDHDTTFIDACRASSIARVRGAIQELGELTEKLKKRASFEEVVGAFVQAGLVPEAAVERLRGMSSELHVEAAPPTEAVEAVQELETLEAELPEEGAGKVRVTTFRKAKGLTSEVVVVMDLDDDLLPADEPDIAEQRRLFYVSMTRAKRFLYLMHVTTRYGRTRSVRSF